MDRSLSAGVILCNARAMGEFERISPDAIETIVRYIHAAGGMPRLELERLDNGESIAAEVARQRYRELELQVGDYLFVTPRNLRFFVEGAPLDYQI